MQPIDAQSLSKSSSLDRRKITLLLWMIPFLTWVLLLFVFTRDTSSTMVPLFSSRNPAELIEVEHFLESQGIDYSVILESNTICIEQNECEAIQRSLIGMGLIKQPDNLNPEPSPIIQ
ncbi:MAG: hypothetical protein RBU29_04120 [bacterium]|nr:hypothetical protein [bacterium]